MILETIAVSLVAMSGVLPDIEPTEEQALVCSVNETKQCIELKDYCFVNEYDKGCQEFTAKLLSLKNNDPT